MTCSDRCKTERKKLKRKSKKKDEDEDMLDSRAHAWKSENDVQQKELDDKNRIIFEAEEKQRKIDEIRKAKEDKIR